MYFIILVVSYTLYLRFHTIPLYNHIDTAIVPTKAVPQGPCILQCRQVFHGYGNHAIRFVLKSASGDRSLLSKN